jgi:large subunit ribosomal protein L32
MAVPKKKKSKSKSRSHRAAARSICPRCGSAKLPHVVCPTCGWYKNRVAIDV